MNNSFDHSNIFFQIIVVCLNAGNKLLETVGSVLLQSYENYQILVKDGGSTDGSVESLKERYKDDRLLIVSQKDCSIYDAMNQGIQLSRQSDLTLNTYYLFLNCGDYLQDAEVLADVAKDLEDTIKTFPEQLSGKKQPGLRIIYGNRFNALTSSVESSPVKIDAFTCFRNIPCHQTCFYSGECFETRQYEPMYKVRADYEHFLWCYFVGKADFISMDRCIVQYEGGGYSETKENEKRSMEEHKEITRKYMSLGQRFLFKSYLIVTLQPLRHAIATNPRLAEGYNKLVRSLRGRK